MCVALGADAAIEALQAYLEADEIKEMKNENN